MKSSLTLLRTLSLCALLTLSLTLPALGVTRVKSGSGYGDFTGATSNDVMNCSNGSTQTCEAFTQVANPGTLDGATVLNAYEFADSDNGGEEVEIFNLGNISNPITLTGDPSLQIFACGANFAKNGAVSSVAFDNVGNPIPVFLPCTPVSDSSSDYKPCVLASSETCTTDAGNKQFAVTFDQNGITFNSTNGDDVVVVSDMGPVATVEPATVSLLAVGLIGLIGILVHRTS
jgi:hypothetical protein